MKVIAEKSSSPITSFLIVLLLVGLAAVLRVWPLAGLASEVTWLTFYPAVIAVGLYVGLSAGLMATVLACLTVIFFLPLLVTDSFIESRFDLLEMALFVIVSGFTLYLIDIIRRTREALQQVALELQTSREDQKFIRTIFNAIPSMVGYWDKDLRCRDANNAYYEWFGKRSEEIIGLCFKDLVGEQLFNLNKPYIKRVLAGESQRFERTLIKVDGCEGHIIGHYIPDFDNDGTVKGFFILASEVTVLKETAENLKLAACVFENTLDGVLITDVDGTILSVNPAFIDITGYTAEEAVGQTPRILHSDQHEKAFYTSMWQDITTNGRWHGEIWNRRKDGDLYLQRMTISMVPDVDGEPVRYVSVFSDITALWRKDEHIKHLAFHDALTDLPNRTLLMDRINQKLINANRTQCDLALMFLDLDGFKPINDRFGHNVGDYLLKEVAKRLLVLVRESDTVARFGGDEFMFVLNNSQGKEEVKYIADRVISAINEPIKVNGESLHIGASIGIAMYPEGGQSPTELIKNADTAMYAAKRQGKNRINFFSTDSEFTQASE